MRAQCARVGRTHPHADVNQYLIGQVCGALTITSVGLEVVPFNLYKQPSMKSGVKPTKT